LSGIVPLGSLNETPYFHPKTNNMDYKTSFAAIMSYALERDLMSYSVAKVINLMKSEYKTEDFSIAAHRQLSSLNPKELDVFGSYAKVIDAALYELYMGDFYPERLLDCRTSVGCKF